MAEEEKVYVYVQAPDGSPLMPTANCGKVRIMLKNGTAKVIRTKPFTIRLEKLTGEPETKPLTLGIDPGRVNIGLAVTDDDGECVFNAKVQTRNKKIPDLMSKRRMCRHASRRGKRLKRKRIAKRNSTVTDFPHGRKLPGCKEPLMLKDIINKESRFCNRRREPGWLTPTARHLKDTHLNIIREIRKILPVTDVAIEINRFAFMQLEAGKRLYGQDFTKGPLKGFDSVDAAVYADQRGICPVCGRPIEHIHHIVQRSKGGSDTFGNKVGVCEICHKKAHTGDEDVLKKLKEYKKGHVKKYNSLSILNTIIPYLISELVSIYGQEHVTVVDPKETAAFRSDAGIEKDHNTDAFVISCCAKNMQPEKTLLPEPYMIMQFRNHDRAVIKRQTERTYYDGKKAVAKNRKPRFEQSGDSLLDVYEKLTKEKGTVQANVYISKLTVKPSKRSYNNLKRIMPGTVFVYKGKNYVLNGQLSNGQYFRTIGQGEKNFPARDCQAVKQGGGLVFV